MRIKKVQGYTDARGAELSAEERELRNAAMEDELELTGLGIGAEVEIEKKDRGDGWVRVRGMFGTTIIPKECLG